MKKIKIKTMYTTFFVLGILGAIASIISFIGFSYLGLRDLNRLTSASVIVKLVVKTPEYKVDNWENGGRQSIGGVVETPFAFHKGEKIILLIPNGEYQSKFIAPSLMEVTETFSQLIFIDPVYIKDVNKSDSIHFKIGGTSTIGQMNIESGLIEISLNNKKTTFSVLPQRSIKDINGSLVTIPIKD